MNWERNEVSRIFAGLRFLAWGMALYLALKLTAEMSFAGLPDDAHQYVKTHRFRELEDYAEKARAEKRERLHPQLCLFYDNVQVPERARNDAAFLAFLPHLEKWKEAFPQSITPRVALFDFYLEYAWLARGGGWASEVTEEGWKGFRERLVKAQMVFEEAEKLPSKDPELYARSIALAMGQSWPRAQMEELFRKGMEISPDYYSLYFRKRYYLARKWHGEAGEWQTFARKAADQIGGEDGDILYAGLVFHGMREEGEEIFKPAEQDGLAANPLAVSYARVKRGGLAAIARAPQKVWYLNEMALAACLAKDRQTALALMCRTADHRSAEAWKDDAGWKKHLAWADGEGRLEQARALEEQGKWEEAAKIYRALPVPPEENRLLDQMYYRQGLALERQGRYEDAEKAYLATSTNWVSHTQALQNLYFHFGKAGRVADYLKGERAEWTPASAPPEHKYNLMLDYLLLRDFEQARAFGVEFNRERPWNLNGYGALYAIALHQGDAAAIKDLRDRVLAMKTDRKAYLYAQSLMRGEKIWNGAVPELDPKDPYFRQSVFMIALDYQYQKRFDLRDAILKYALNQLASDHATFPSLESQQLASLLYGALKFAPF